MLLTEAEIPPHLREFFEKVEGVGVGLPRNAHPT